LDIYVENYETFVPEQVDWAAAKVFLPQLGRPPRYHQSRTELAAKDHQI